MLCISTSNSLFCKKFHINSLNQISLADLLYDISHNIGLDRSKVTAERNSEDNRSLVIIQTVKAELYSIF